MEQRLVKNYAAMADERRKCVRMVAGVVGFGGGAALTAVLLNTPLPGIIVLLVLLSVAAIVYDRARCATVRADKIERWIDIRLGIDAFDLVKNTQVIAASKQLTNSVDWSGLKADQFHYALACALATTERTLGYSPEITALRLETMRAGIRRVGEVQNTLAKSTLVRTPDEGSHGK